jgi:hypothetical protein
MTGREPKLDNDLFFICSVIEYIGRATKNRRADVVNALGKDVLARYLELADVYHCEPIENTAGDLIEKCNIPIGSFETTAGEFRIPAIIPRTSYYGAAFASMVQVNRY